MATMQDVFEVLLNAGDEDIKLLGYRLGEKMDSRNPWDEIIAPLMEGISTGTTIGNPYTKVESYLIDPADWEIQTGNTEA
jgi:hypothetical protein